MCYHPMAAYQCLFDPNVIFYTKDDLVLHCKRKEKQQTQKYAR